MRNLTTGDTDYNVIDVFDLPDATVTNHTNLTIGTASASTAALTRGVYRFSSTADCNVVQGATATTAHLPLSANQPEYFVGSGVVSAIAAAAGTLTLTRV